MLVAENEQNEELKRCIAWETEKDESPFFCPKCGADVLLKKGKKKIHHFAHVPPFNCIYGQGESELHLKAKKDIYLALKDYKDCSKCEIERHLDGVRPDISLMIRDKYVAIEIQKSNIDIETIIQRTMRYKKLGIYLLWIIPFNKPKQSTQEGYEDITHIPDWGKYIHSMYYGRMYYWQYGAVVTAFHFKTFSRYIPIEIWHNEEGDSGVGGGYEKYMKYQKTMYPLYKPLHIADNFIAKSKPIFKTKNIEIPECNLWIDSNPSWWEKEKWIPDAE
jgi:competence protein CoiA